MWKESGTRYKGQKEPNQWSRKVGYFYLTVFSGHLGDEDAWYLMINNDKFKTKFKKQSKSKEFIQGLAEQQLRLRLEEALDILNKD